MAIELRTEIFDVGAELQRYQNEILQASGKYGATAIFVGTMRDFNEGDSVQEMMLEHYPGMTEKHLQTISDEVRRRWDVIDSLVIHRVGRILPDEPIVLVAVWSTHRAAAFDACRYLIEELKTRAPFWKREETSKGARWVERNTP